jgi:hypothetical protein
MQLMLQTQEAHLKISCSVGWNRKFFVIVNQMAYLVVDLLPIQEK